MGFWKIAGRGLLLGAVAGAIWAARRIPAGAPPRLIQWTGVRQVAANVGRRDRTTNSFDRPNRTRQYEQMVGRSEDVIARYVGQPLPQSLEAIHVFDRTEWVDANVANFQELFEPLENVNYRALEHASLAGHLFGTLNQTVLTTQLGLLIGYLSRRVLGQYDIALLGREPVTTGRLYFVEPNIARIQQQLGLPSEDFRLWIALHETTHAFEFEAHPWLRGYMNGLLTQYFDSVCRDFGDLALNSRGVVSLAQRVGSNLLRSQHALELLMNGEQRDLFNKLQALMCLLEGYSNHVMDAIGREILPSYATMKIRFDSRRQQRSPSDRLFARLTGLDMKLEQYVRGEKFVNHVVTQVGINRANQVWESPWYLPTLEEIDAPDRWLARLERRAPAV